MYRKRLEFAIKEDDYTLPILSLSAFHYILGGYFLLAIFTPSLKQPPSQTILVTILSEIHGKNFTHTFNVL